MKRNYQEPELERIALSEVDVICTSNDPPEGETDEEGNAWTPWV